MALLTDSLTVRGHVLRNRIALPPMVMFGWGDADGIATARHAAHYGQIARAGTALVIVEAACVLREARLSRDQIGVWDDAQIAGLAGIAEAIRAGGAVSLLQIHHGGFQANAAVTDMRESASERDTNPPTRAMTSADIERVERAFVDAALRARRAGFDGVELHGAHGYLLSEFFSPVTNRRTDEYGGGPENRARLAVEIGRRIREAVGERFIITCRMGANAPDMAGGIAIAQAMEPAFDMLHVSNIGSFGDEVRPPEDWRFTPIAWLGAQVAAHVRVPVIAVNGLQTPRQASALLSGTNVAMAAVGTAMLRDARWSARALEDPQAEAPLCLGCKPCRLFQSPEKCPARMRAD